MAAGGAIGLTVDDDSKPAPSARISHKRGAVGKWFSSVSHEGTKTRRREGGDDRRSMREALAKLTGSASLLAALMLGE
jgi:hypothetical protein